MMDAFQSQGNPGHHLAPSADRAGAAATAPPVREAWKMDGRLQHKAKTAGGAAEEGIAFFDDKRNVKVAPDPVTILPYSPHAQGDA